jgi:tetratricopeptide (TPR) repeat protein
MQALRLWAAWLAVVLITGLAVADDRSSLAALDELLARGEAETAVILASGLLEPGAVEPRNLWRVRQRLGAALIAAGRPDEAVGVLEAVLGEVPDDAASHLNLARALQMLGKGGRAVAEFEAALALAPERFEWRLEYAEALDALGIRRDALHQIKRARRDCADCEVALRGEVNHYLASGEAAAAAEPLGLLYARQPDPETRRLLALVLSSAGEVAAATALLDTVPVTAMTGAEVMILIQADRQLGASSRAVAWARAPGPELPAGWQPGADFWAIVAEICLRAEEAEAALTAIDRALAREPGQAVYHHNRAAILLALGREDEARAALAEARRLDPAQGGSP